MKKIITALLALVMLLTVTGCFNSGPVYEEEPKLYTSDGFEITLTKAFKEASFEGYNACYDSRDVAVFVLEEEFSLVEGFENYSLDQYAKLVRDSNSSKNPSEIQHVDGLTVLEYDFYNEDEGVTYSYFLTMFKGEDAFWLIQFACEKNNYETHRPYFIDWAKTVKV